MLRRVSIKLVAEGSSAGLLSTFSTRTAEEIYALGRCASHFDSQINNKYNVARCVRWFRGGMPGRGSAAGRKGGVYQHDQAKKRASEQCLYLVGLTI